MATIFARLRKSVAPAAATTHPSATPWHDGHTDFHVPASPPLAKNTAIQFSSPFGSFQPGAPVPTHYFEYANKTNQIADLVRKHGFKTLYHGGKFGNPNFGSHNYNTNHLWIADPTSASHPETQYTDGWRQLHELSYALTAPKVNGVYGVARRSGQLSPHEAQRAVHWAWEAGNKQRELSRHIGVHLPEEAFNREMNTVLHNAVHHALTGRPATEPGFVPHSHAVPLHVALDVIREHAQPVAAPPKQPTITVHKAELAKGWPKDERENADNASGFLEHPVAQDTMLEAGFQRTPVKSQTLKEKKSAVPKHPDAIRRTRQAEHANHRTNVAHGFEEYGGVPGPSRPFTVWSKRNQVYSGENPVTNEVLWWDDLNSNQDPDPNSPLQNKGVPAPHLAIHDGGRVNEELELFATRHGAFRTLMQLRERALRAQLGKKELAKAWPKPVSPEDRGGKGIVNNPDTESTISVNQDAVLEGHPSVTALGERPLPLPSGAAVSGNKRAINAEKKTFLPRTMTPTNGPLKGQNVPYWEMNQTGANRARVAHQSNDGGMSFDHSYNPGLAGVGVNPRFPSHSYTGEFAHTQSRDMQTPENIFWARTGDDAHAQAFPLPSQQDPQHPLSYHYRWNGPKHIEIYGQNGQSPSRLNYLDTMELDPATGFVSTQSRHPDDIHAKHINAHLASLNGLHKAWPKDERENADNASGFLEHPVAQDTMLEAGAVRQEHTAQKPARELVDTDSEQNPNDFDVMRRFINGGGWLQQDGHHDNFIPYHENSLARLRERAAKKGFSVLGHRTADEIVNSIDPVLGPFNPFASNPSAEVDPRKNGSHQYEDAFWREVDAGKPVKKNVDELRRRALAKSELIKNKGPLTFPKLGIPDDRRETNIVSNRRQYQIAVSSIGQRQANKRSEWMGTPPRDAERIARDTKTIASPTFKMASGASFDTTGFARTGAAAYKGKKALAMGLQSTVPHENFHNIMGRVQQTIFQRLKRPHQEPDQKVRAWNMSGKVRRQFARQLVSAGLNGLSQQDASFVNHFLSRHVEDPEEQIAHTISFLNDPEYRKNWNPSTTVVNAVHGALKKFYRNLQRHSKTVDSVPL